MALRITCPGCKTALTLEDDARGTRVRCDECDKVLNIPAASAKARKPSASAPHEDEPDERPAKKKKGKKQKKGSPVLLLVGAGAVLLVLLVVGGLSAFFLTRPNAAQQAKAAQKKADEQPKPDGPGIDAGVPADPVKPKDDPGFRVIPRIEEGNPAAKKGGTGIVANVRGTGYRLERKQELKQIGALYTAFHDEYKGSSRTLDNFLKSIKRDAGPIHTAIQEGYYKINMNARLEGSSIIGYERDKDHAGYLSVMGDGSVRYVPEHEWKQALGIK